MRFLLSPTILMLMYVLNMRCDFEFCCVFLFSFLRCLVNHRVVLLRNITFDDYLILYLIFILPMMMYVQERLTNF